MSNKKEIKTNNWISDFFFKNRYGTIMFLVGAIVAFWDLFLKSMLDGKNMSAIKGVFSIVSTHNTGGAWSIFAGSTVPLIIFSILFIIVLIVFNCLLNKKNYFYAISMGLLLSGAISNLFDRLMFGYVRDFISLDFLSFPIFNIADIAITFGVIFLCIYFVFIQPKLENKEKEQNNASAEKFIEKVENNQQVNVLIEQHSHNNSTHKKRSRHEE